MVLIIGAIMVSHSGTDQPGNANSATAIVSNDTLPQPVLGMDDPSLPPKVREAYKLMDQCLGSYDKNDPACPKMEAVERAIRDDGWCYGEPGDDASSRDWHKCEATEREYISENRIRWIKECRKVILAELINPDQSFVPDFNKSEDYFVFHQEDQRKKGYDNSVVVKFPFYTRTALGGNQEYFGSCLVIDDAGQSGDQFWKISNHLIQPVDR